MSSFMKPSYEEAGNTVEISQYFSIFPAKQREGQEMKRSKEYFLLTSVFLAWVSGPKRCFCHKKRYDAWLSNTTKTNVKEVLFSKIFSSVSSETTEKRTKHRKKPSKAYSVLQLNQLWLKRFWEVVLRTSFVLVITESFAFQWKKKSNHLNKSLCRFRT